MLLLRSVRTSYAIILIFIATGIFIYLPVFGNGFLSDDYDSLYRIYIQKRIIYREFLRPMIDISFYFNFLISGLSPWSYYLFNIVVHILNSLLLFRFASGFILFEKNDQNRFALLTSFLFLIYPFHNESIVWLSGRLSSMACCFALISLILVNEKNGKASLLIAALFFLLGLLCYESIILLPMMILTIDWIKEKSINKIYLNALFWLLISGIYFIVRYYMSGVIIGDYGSRLSDTHIMQKILNAGKVFGRLFLPGSEDQKTLIFLTFGIAVFLTFLSFSVHKCQRFNKKGRLKWKALMLMIIISLIIPVAFGVSTKTSESDRLLYFPSSFLCMLISFYILLLIQKRSGRIIWFSVISVYFLFFLEINNHQWAKASRTAETILDTIRNRNGNNIILMNVPDELEGAFVFRNGLTKALIINNIDTSHVKVLNYLKREDYLKTGKTIPAFLQDSTRVIFPDWTIVEQSDASLLLVNARNRSSIRVQKDRNLIYYWNKETLIRLF